MLRSWYANLIERWDVVRGSYWFFPAQLTLLAAVAAFAMVELDRRIAARRLEVPAWIGDVTAEGARAVLSTIAGSMMTVTGVVFSITVVALTLASSQFGPRLLRTFFRDRGSQAALGTFLATFLFNLLVLRAVENSDRVPLVATGAAVVLAVVSLFVLIFYIHHAASSIQASSVIAAVACEIEEQIPTLFPERLGREPDDPDAISKSERARLERAETGGDPIRSTREGYVRVIDEPTLLRVAEERDLLVRIYARPGDFVAEGAIVARFEPAAHASPEDRTDIESSFLYGDHRTPVQDLAFSIEQISQMAVRALSPGTNDPGTAIACIHRLGGLLARLCNRSMPSGLRVGETGRLRVVVEPTRYADLVASCFDSIRRYGSDDPDVVVALLDALVAGVAAGASDARRRVLEEHAEEIHRAWSQKRPDGGSKRDRDLVDAAYVRTVAALAAEARPTQEA